MCPDANPAAFGKQFAREVKGINTEFVFQRLANKWFMIITQYGSLPNMYTICFDINSVERLQMPELHGPILNPDFYVPVPVSMTCNFGADKDEVRAGLQFLINRTALNRCPNEILISFGIKQIDGATLKELANILDNDIFNGI